MALPTIGANLSAHNPSRLWAIVFRKLGFKARAVSVQQPTRNYNGQPDDGTNKNPLVSCIFAKYHATTAPASNTVADAPSGYGDLCVFIKSNASKDTTYDNVAIYRCTAYVSNSSFTWTAIVPLTDT